LIRDIIIKKNEEFQTIFDQGHSMYGRYLVVYFLQNNFTTTRFGICVGKKIGKAVTRNRVKRLFREAIHVIELERIVGLDLLLVARHSVLRANLSEIINDLNHITKKAGMFH
jgi:ribonuclease P protein component